MPWEFDFDRDRLSKKKDLLLLVPVDFTTGNRNFENCEELWTNIIKRAVDKGTVVGYARRGQGALWLRMETEPQALRLHKVLKGTQLMNHEIQVAAQLYSDWDWPPRFPPGRNAYLARVDSRKRCAF